MAKLLRRRMHVTLPDVVDVNHSSKAVRVAASLVTVWNYLAWTAGQVAGIVLVITTFTDLNGTAAVIVAYIIIVLFTLLGGFRAVVYTDSLQAVLFLVVLGLVTLRYCCFTTTCPRPWLKPLLSTDFTSFLAVCPPEL